jgi:hypothetical protein
MDIDVYIKCFDYARESTLLNLKDASIDTGQGDPSIISMDGGRKRRKASKKSKKYKKTKKSKKSRKNSRK